MKIGIDLNYHSINAVLLDNDLIVKSVHKPLNDGCKDAKKIIMANILSVIDQLMQQNITGIGISLPSNITPERGVVYDLRQIPHWKGIRLREIISEKFGQPVYFNSDVNCILLGEKHFGAGKDCSDIACINFDKNIGTGGIINNQLCMYSKDSFERVKCLSQCHYTSIKQYSESYLTTIDELEYFAQAYPEELKDPEHEIWNNIGMIVGRLIAILFNNYNPKLMVLSGQLSKSFHTVIESIHQYIKIFQRSNRDILSAIIPSSTDNIKALGAVALIPNA